MASNRIRKLTRKTGMQPGSLVFTGKQKSEEVRVHLTRYNSEKLEEKEFLGLNGMPRPGGNSR